MTQPTEYLRQYSFSVFQTANPEDPLPAVKVELEFNAIKTTLDQIRTNLALIQRDDGEIANSVIGAAQMDGSLISLAFERPTNWATATAYLVDEAVFTNNKLYVCEIAHTSGTFATDLAAAKWVESIDFSSLVTLADAAAAAAAVSEAAAAASAVAAAAAVADALPLVGGTMTGPIVTSGDATLATHAPRFGQVQSGIVRHATSTGGTADVITTVHSPVRTAWATGMSGCFTAGAANTTTTPTMNPDGIGAKTFLKNNLQALVAGDIAGAGHEVEWEYNGTNLIIKNPSSANAYTVNGQTQETAPATGDFLGGYDLSGTAERKFSIIDVLEVLNLLTEDTTPDEAADFLLIYDTSAGTVKKVKPSNIETTVTTITLVAEQASTSGTAITFGSIPAGVKRITVMFDNVSFTALGVTVLCQIGDAGGIETTGYVSGAHDVDEASVAGFSTSTSGFNLMFTDDAATEILGQLILNRQDSAHTWIGTWTIYGTGAGAAVAKVQSGAGAKQLSAELTQLVVNGGTFDAGSISISYE